MEFHLEIDPNEPPCIRVGKDMLKLELEDIDEVYRQKSSIELRETVEIKEESIKRFRELLNGTNNDNNN